MPWDLVVTQQTFTVFLSSTDPFPAEPAGLTLFARQRLLKVEFADGSDLLMEYELDPVLVAQMRDATEAVMVHMDGLDAKEGFKVPLTSVEG